MGANTMEVEHELHERGQGRLRLNERWVFAHGLYAAIYSM